jgi:uncharacterized protein
MKPFCEIVVSSVIPAIRALVAKELMDEHNLTQQQAADKLGVSQAAVSQYRRELRGSRVKILQKSKKVMTEIKTLSTKVANNKVNHIDSLIEICKLCKIIRKEKLICAMHYKADHSLKDCKLCLGASGCTQK